MKIPVRTWAFSNGAWLRKSLESCDIDADVLEHIVSVEETTFSLHRVTDHRCVSAFWSCSLMPNYHCAIFTRVGSHLERRAACVVPASVLICTLVRGCLLHLHKGKRQFYPSIVDERLLPTLHSGAVVSISASEGKCLAKA